MIHFIPGSQLWQLITLLSFVGEYPHRSRQLLGNKNAYKILINSLTRPQTICNPQTGATMTCRLLSVSGKWPNKTVRLYKGALPILEWIEPGMMDYYLRSFRNHRFSGDQSHVERNHRIAEVAAMCMRSGIERLSEDEMSKTSFTRLVGALFASGTGYSVYNTRDATMKWSGKGEFKARDTLKDLSNMNSKISAINSAILFGQSETVALNTITESDKSRKQEFRFDAIYRNIYFIPLSEDGMRQLRFLTVPNWNEKILDLLFEPEDRSYNRGLFEYDAVVDGEYVYSYLDGDIARLIRLHQTLDVDPKDVVVLCFPHQIAFLRGYLGRRVEIRVIDMDTVEEELGPERRNLFER